MNEDKVREAVSLFDSVWPESDVYSHQVEKVRQAFKEALALPRFYKNQPVLVSDGSNRGWKKDRIVSIEGGPCT